MSLEFTKGAGEEVLRPETSFSAELHRLAEETRRSAGWSEPVEFDLSEEEGVQKAELLFGSTPGIRVHDNVSEIADNLYELDHPDRLNDEEGRQSYVQNIESQGLGFGKWFYFPWSRELVRYPDKEKHRALITGRNRMLVTSTEQERLHDSTIAVFGLSVGSNVVENLLRSGIGGKLIIADMDVVDPSNLNRIDGEMADVGKPKVDLMAKKISKADPYIEQVHLRNGVSREAISDVMSSHRPDIIIDEVDDLSVKAVIRQSARQEELPVIMATDVGDKSVVDVERYDLGEADPFAGRVHDRDMDLLTSGELTDKERGKLMLKIVGVRNLNIRLIDSLAKQGTELAGLPQLGTTAAVGGALASVASREILLGRGVETGRYVCSPKSILKMSAHNTKVQAVKSIGRFIKSSRS